MWNRMGYLRKAAAEQAELEMKSYDSLGFGL
jgi:hypothetical protein